MSSSPVFIGGFRSGTTLLINLLGMHTDIAPWFETKELCEALRYMRVLAQPANSVFEADHCLPPSIPGFTLPAVVARMRQQMFSTDARIKGKEASGKAAYEKYPVGNDCAAYTFAEAESGLQRWQSSVGHDVETIAMATGQLINELGSLHCARYGAPHWINKTPEISRFGAELRKALGSCRIVYVVRDGMQVAASGLKLGWGSIDKLAFSWKYLLEQTRATMQDFPQDYLEIRYETLIRKPAATLDSVMQFCGHEKTGNAIIEEFQNRFGATAFAVEKLTEVPNLNSSERTKFLHIAGDLQRELGYPTD